MGAGHHSSLPDPRGRAAKRGVGPAPGWVHQVAWRGAALFTGPWRQSNLKASRAPCCPTGLQHRATLREWDTTPCLGGPPDGSRTLSLKGPGPRGGKASRVVCLVQELGCP